MKKKRKRKTDRNVKQEKLNNLSLPHSNVQITDKVDIITDDCFLIDWIQNVYFSISTVIFHFHMIFLIIFIVFSYFSPTQNAHTGKEIGFLFSQTFVALTVVRKMKMWAKRKIQKRFPLADAIDDCCFDVIFSVFHDSSLRTYRTTSRHSVHGRRGEPESDTHVSAMRVIFHHVVVKDIHCNILAVLHCEHNISQESEYRLQRLRASILHWKGALHRTYGMKYWFSGWLEGIAIECMLIPAIFRHPFLCFAMEKQNISLRYQINPFSLLSSNAPHSIPLPSFMFNFNNFYHHSPLSP